MTKLALACVFLLLGGVLHAQERQTEHTLKLVPGATPAPASIADMAWLAGHWEGEALGGISEEVWTEPKSGVMLGMYRLLRDGKPVFYELLTLSAEAGSLVIRLKHFNPDMTGWEEKDKTVDFRLVAKRDRQIYFGGMTFQPEGDAMTVYLAIGQKDGGVREEVFRYRRVKRPS